MHDFHKRHDDAFRVICRVDVGDHIFDDGARHALLRRLKGRERSVFVIRRMIQAGHIYAVQAGQTAQTFLAGDALLLALLHHVDGFQRADFAVADGKCVDERIQRFRVERAGAARNHNRVIPCAILAAQRNPGQIEHFQNIGVAHLILKGDAQHVKAADRRTCFQRKQRNAFLTHQIGHIHPRHKNTLAERILPLVDDIVQNTRTEMAHADLVNIRERKSVADIYAVRVFEHAIHFAAHVSRRFLNAVEQAVNLFLEQSISSPSAV